MRGKDTWLVKMESRGRNISPSSLSSPLWEFLYFALIPYFHPLRSVSYYCIGYLRYNTIQQITPLSFLLFAIPMSVDIVVIKIKK